MISKATKAGIDLGAIPAKVSENVRAIATAGFAKLVDDVNQYAAPMYAPTAGAAQAPRPVRTRARIRATSPAVATASPTHRCHPERSVPDRRCGTSNIRFASNAPATPPTVCATE